MYKARLTIPEKGNPYYNTRSNGGYSNAIKGSPTENGLDVLRNCVGYANGRFAEVQNLGRIKYQLVCNAEKFIDKAKAYGLTVGATPKLGAIIVWQGGSAKTASDGAGHVAIVEKINSDGSIVTSESGYKARRAFWTQTRNNKTGRWGQNKNYTFLGFIYNPAVKDETPEYYIIKRGDTLSKIAKMYGVTVSAIAQANNITNVNLIRVGQRLLIPR